MKSFVAKSVVGTMIAGDSLAIKETPVTKDEELIERLANARRIVREECGDIPQYVRTCIEAALADAADRLEALAQPVVGVEGLAKAKAVNLILAELLAPLIPDLFERIEVGNRVCSLILADLAVSPSR